MLVFIFVYLKREIYQHEKVSGFIAGCIICFLYNLDAQTLKPILISYFHEKVQPQIFTEFEIAPKSLIYSNTLSANQGIQVSSGWNFKYTLPKGAIFCRKEDAIYNKLNFWVKFRIGTDERYSN